MIANMSEFYLSEIAQSERKELEKFESIISEIETMDIVNLQRVELFAKKINERLKDDY